MVIAERENSYKGVKANNQSIVIKQAVVIGANPIWHLIKIGLMKIGGITIDSKKHLYKIQGVIP